MPRGCCRGHAPGQACTCSLGNLYRFVEPVLLYLLKSKGSAHGYELMTALAAHSLTDATTDSAVTYRTLRQLELAGMVASTWDLSGTGPARRRYQLTEAGEERLRLWVQMLEQLSGSMTRFVDQVRAVHAET
ncbi:MAG: PadR family transcriptional regulator [Symbiobacteriaceae bacterium]|nr:PadR family transcriptional regulator [Symbiobacteriaceae bacterium]